jgi:RHS repeat-associated protein
VDQIFLRPPGGSALYTANFNYTNYTGTGLMSSMALINGYPNSDLTSFGYQVTSAGTFLDTIIDPRSQTSTFTYDTRFFTPLIATTPPFRGSPLTMTFRDQWRRAAPREGYARGSQPLERLLYLNQYRGTFFPVQGTPTDYQADQFGATTYVRHFAPPPYFSFPFGMLSQGGDDVRTITRDSTSRVLKIVAAGDTAAIADSVLYQYDPNGNLLRMIRPTAQWPVPANTLDTTSYVYDSLGTANGLPLAYQRCIRMRTMTDPMGGTTNINYGASGAGQCLPIDEIGLAADTTTFGYGTLAAGNTAGVRPIYVIAPTGVRQDVTYDATTWNTATSTRYSDGAQSRMFYDLAGRADSMVDPVATPSVTHHDQIGRVYLARTGTGATAPVTQTFFSHGGLVDSVQVYGTTSSVAASPATAVQTSRYFYNALGWVDSSRTPGGRSQRYLRDAVGHPFFEYTGHGAYISRQYDWQDRLLAEYQSQVRPGYSVDGTAFADAATTSAYQAWNLAPVVTLSGGEMHRFSYDTRGRVFAQFDSTLTTNRGFNRLSQLIADTLTFLDGAKVTRSYQYNRRGQRTTVIDTVRQTSNNSVLGWGRTDYSFDAVTARLSSLTAAQGGSTVATASWTYDTPGRVTNLSLLAGGSSSALGTTYGYDGASRVSSFVTTSSAGTWYSFSNPSYSLIDELQSLSVNEPQPSGGGPNLNESFNGSHTYATDGTRRLVASVDFRTSSSWTYDVFGNRLTQLCSSGYSACNNNDASNFGTDNRLLYTRNVAVSGNPSSAFYTDAMGNRILERDSTNGVALSSPTALLSYTAKGQLFFSMTPTASVGTYDYNWHSYDGAGRRVVSAVQQGSTWSPGTGPTGNRTYYVYDGSDVALMLVKTSLGAWRVQSRFIVGGVDQPLGGWFNTGSGTGPENLVFVNDYQGSTRAAVRADGTREDNAQYFSRNAFGALEGASGTGSSYNTQTGFGGASTPNASGGFTYLRNRWYDPTTGRFLTQDPIGLAGGVNLYAYAGNNPVAFNDPFGLCHKPGGKGVGICLETFIQGRFGGYGDNRGPSATGGTYRTSTRFSIDPSSGKVSGVQNHMGFTNGEGRGMGGLSASVRSDGANGWNLTLRGEALNGSGLGPMIDYKFDLHVSPQGKVDVVGGKHDGFPSYELWVYPQAGGDPRRKYYHEQGSPTELVGSGNVDVSKRTAQATERTP